jgi:hypothetical protein
MVSAAALLLTPAVLELARTPNWLLHPSWNGSGYTLGAHGVIPAVLDPTGSATVLATLDQWRGGGVSGALVFEALSDRGFDYRLASFASPRSQQVFVINEPAARGLVVLLRLALPLTTAELIATATRPIAPDYLAWIARLPLLAALRGAARRAARPLSRCPARCSRCAECGRGRPLARTYPPFWP